MACARRARPLLATLLATLLAAACSTPPAPQGPIPVAVTPSRGTGATDLPVVIVGDHFAAAAQTDFDQGSGALSAAFQARLLPEGGGVAVPLAAVRLTADRKLEATVPAGIARGGYSLEVVDPAGRTGTLAQAFTIYSPPESVVTFRVEPSEEPHAGIPFPVALTAVDAGGALVDGFEGQVTLADLTGTLAPTVAGPFARGRLSLRLSVSALSTADRITATDSLGHAGSSDPFAVTAGPPVAISLSGAPASLATGACSAPITVGLRDAAGYPATATGPVAVALQSAPTGAVAFYAGTSCATPIATVAIPAGASSVAFRCAGAVPSSALIRAVPDGLPSATLAVTITP